VTWDPAALFEALEHCVAVYTPDGTFVYANAASERLFGHPRDRLVGQRVWDLFPDAFGDPFQAAFARVHETGRAETLDHHHTLWDRWYRNHIHAHGERIHVVAADITGEKTAEQRLLALSRASQAFARAADSDGLYSAIAAVLAETLGDGCAVRIVDGEALRTVALAHPDPEALARMTALHAASSTAADELTVRVLTDGEPMLLPTVDPDAARWACALAPGVHSLVAAALRDGDRRIGAAILGRDRTRRAFGPDDRSLLQDIVDRASMALARTRLYESAERDRRRASALASASRAFGGAQRDMRTILDLLTRIAADELGECATAAILADDRTNLEVVAVHHRDPSQADAVARLFASRTPLVGSLSARVLASGAPLRISAVDVEAFAGQLAHPDHAAMVRRWPPRSFLMAPIIAGDHALGTLTVCRLTDGAPYDAHDEALLLELAGRAALAIENVQALAAERRAREASEAAAARSLRLLAITTQLSDSLGPRELAEVVLRESAAALGGATAAIWLLDAAGHQLEMLASRGYSDTEQFARVALTEGAPLCAAVREGAPVYVESVAELRRAYPETAERVQLTAPPDHATACLPLLAEGRRPIGAMAFTYHAAHAFTDDERNFLEVLAYQCAQALDRHRLTDRERTTSAALAETGSTLAAIVAASPAAIVLLDLDGTVRLWNPAAERIFGWTAEEVIGRPPPVVGLDQVAEFRTNLAEIAAGRTLEGVEARRLTRGGGLVDIALWAAPIVRPDGTRQCIALVVDITDRKRAEAAAQAANRRKDEFLAMLGHELRNPLAPILTAVEVLKLRRVAGLERELGILERQAGYLVRLVDDLLDISRITRGAIELHRAPTDLAVVLARAVEMASPLLEERRQHLTIVAPHGPILVDGDEFRLAQVVQNLLTNAAKYTAPGGHVAVRTATGDGSVVVEVEDDGTGIPTDLLPVIFEPFIQGARGIDRAEGGLGIGLALVHSLVSLHGGAVSAHSDGPGRGSRFTITLPRSGAASPDPAAPTGPIAAARTGRRVLLVDDNHDAADILAELLRFAGHDVRVVSDGPAALELVRAFRPDVAILDIGLPVMDGYELARRLRAAVPAPIRLVALTGYGQDHDRERSRAAGFAEHVVKPVDGARLLALIDA
jgi:PAS domain S-box-containing protein